MYREPKFKKCELHIYNSMFLGCENFTCDFGVHTYSV